MYTEKQYEEEKQKLESNKYKITCECCHETLLYCKDDLDKWVDTPVYGSPIVKCCNCGHLQRVEETRKLCLTFFL